MKRFCSEFLVLVMAVLLAILPACPSSSKPPTGPPVGPGPLNIVDSSHFRQSTGTQLLSAEFAINDGNFPNTIVSGFIPDGTKIWYVPEAMVNGMPADVSFKEATVVYRTIYGATFTYHFEVEKVPESQGGGYRIIGDADLLATVAIGATATNIIIAGVTLDIIQCAVWGWGFLLWPLGCFPGPLFKAPAEIGAFDIGAPTPVVYDWESNKSFDNKSLAVAPKGWVEILFSNNLFTIDVSAVYTVPYQGGSVDKQWGGRFSFDTDEDGFTNEEEITAGTDPYDPNDFPMDVGLPLEGNMGTAPTEVTVGEVMTSTINFRGSLPSHQFEVVYPDGSNILGQMAANGDISVSTNVGGIEVSGNHGTVESTLVFHHRPTAPTEGGQYLPINVAISGTDGQSVAMTNLVKVNPSGVPTEVAVPNVVGLLQATATSTIQNAGLVVGTIGTSYHASIPAGKVISSAPIAGTQVSLGSSVNLVVSLGPAPGPSLTLVFVSTDADTDYLLSETGHFKATVAGGTPPYSVNVLWPDAGFSSSEGSNTVFNFSRLWVATTGGWLPVRCRVTDNTGAYVDREVSVRIQ